MDYSHLGGFLQLFNSTRVLMSQTLYTWNIKQLLQPVTKT